MATIGPTVTPASVLLSEGMAVIARRMASGTDGASSDVGAAAPPPGLRDRVSESAEPRPASGAIAQDPGAPPGDWIEADAAGGPPAPPLQSLAGLRMPQADGGSAAWRVRDLGDEQAAPSDSSAAAGGTRAGADAPDTPDPVRSRPGEGPTTATLIADRNGLDTRYGSPQTGDRTALADPDAAAPPPRAGTDAPARDAQASPAAWSGIRPDSPDAVPAGRFAAPHAAEGVLATAAEGRGAVAPHRADREAAERVQDRPAEGSRVDEARGDVLRPRALDARAIDGVDLSALDGWTMTAAAAEPQVERAGVIASFILNAAMIPGWPPPRPFAVPEPAALLRDLIGASPDPVREAELLKLLGGRGRSSLLARLHDRLGKLAKSRRLRMLLGLTALSDMIDTVLDALEHELARSGGGRDAEEGEEAPTAFNGVPRLTA